MSKNIKKKLSILSIMFVFILTLAPTYAYSGNESYKVKYNESRKVTRTKDSNKFQEVYYDYGTTNHFDDVRIYATCRGNIENVAFIRYANKGDTVFTVQDKVTDHNEESYVNYQPWGIDYLQPGSYSETKGFKDLKLTVKY